MSPSGWWVLWGWLTSLGSATLDIEVSKCVGTATFLGISPHSIDISRRHGDNLSLCQVHSQNSCCARNHTDLLRNRVRQAGSMPLDFEQDAFSWARGLSVGCSIATENAFCAACDAIAGRSADAVSKKGIINGIRPDRKVPICESFCVAWHKTCRNSYFGQDSQGRFGPCTKESLVCWAGNDIAPDRFCADFGFTIVVDSFNGPYCYNGRRKGADILGPGPKPPSQLMWKDLQKRAIFYLDYASAVIIDTWRRANAMVLWLVVIATLWFFSKQSQAALAAANARVE